MALIDDLLRLFGTNRVRLRWKWDNWKKGVGRGIDAAGDAVKPGKQVGYVPRGQSRMRRWFGWAIPEEFPLVTVGNIVVIIGLYAIMVKATHDAVLASTEEPPGFTPGGLQLIRYGAQYGPLVLHLGEWWRMVTAIFLHLSVLHLIMNTVSLWIAGQAVEELFGRARTLVIWLLTGVGGFAVSIWWRGEMDFTAGASGAGFGLIGAVIGHVARHRGRTTQHLKDRFVPWLLYGVIFSFVPQVNGAAHFGGLAVGILVGAVIADTRQARRAPEWIWRAAAVACLAVILASFWFAYRSPGAALVARAQAEAERELERMEQEP